MKQLTNSNPEFTSVKIASRSNTIDEIKISLFRNKYGDNIKTLYYEPIALIGILFALVQLLGIN